MSHYPKAVAGRVLSSVKSASKGLAVAPLRVFDQGLENMWERKLRLGRLPPAGEVTALLRRNGLSTFSQYVAGEMRGTGARNFLPTDRTAFVEAIRREWPELADDIVARSEQILEGRLTFFGQTTDVAASRVVRGENWRRDPLSGSVFPTGFSDWRWNPATMCPAGGDVKGPWEISRCQHLATLGQAYWLTGDERFAKCFAGTISDFIARNPVRIGVAWACNMDVALRVVGWLTALPFFQGSPALGYRWWKKFCRALVAHGRFIHDHLEYGTLDGRIVTSNHFLADVFGLYWLALNFPGLDAGTVWRGTSERALEHEIRTQIAEDGGPFEASTAYHRLVLEMLLSAWALSVHRRHPLSEEYRNRLECGFEFLAAIREPSGRMPQIGDADDGRAHILSNYGSWDTESADWLLAAGAQVLGRRGLGDSTVPTGIETLLWPKGAVNSPADKVQSKPVGLFPVSGVAVLRANSSHLVFTNGPIGTAGFGNHKHNDQMSMEWSFGAQPFIVDPGSYIYTRDPNDRNAFRGAAMHTTVTVDGAEQHDLRPELLFRLYEAGAPSLEVRESATAIGVIGTHTCYQRLGVAHTRRLTMSIEGWVIVEDLLEGASGHRLDWSFPLHPTVKIGVEEGGLRMSGPRGEALLLSSDLRLNDEDSWYSSGYGQRVGSRRVEATREDGPSRVTWMLVPLATGRNGSDASHPGLETACGIATSLWDSAVTTTSGVT